MHMCAHRDGFVGGNAKVVCGGLIVQCVASVAQLGERQTEDLKVPGSIPGRGTFLSASQSFSCRPSRLRRHRHDITLILKSDGIDAVHASNKRIPRQHREGNPVHN